MEGSQGHAVHRKSPKGPFLQAVRAQALSHTPDLKFPHRPKGLGHTNQPLTAQQKILRFRADNRDCHPQAWSG